ncbi:GatB/YqeY domain-containing protein [Lutibacter sp.]|uniref:GatB/YqeY domain-containing protein n=1 Tax=Lutibacter sp. TaxID=1925666 RepID=UPI001A297122|nr:GatB/YqeY domain-containing protein [Lutibacter sp.]MBI9041622.1 GatB/YqeY domain-containing protein [Lutibacter sp.]
MSLQEKVMDKMKEAMKSKNSIALESLRAIKSELLLLQTKGGTSDKFNSEDEIKLLQKLVKQRKDSAALYIEQGREDLADPELAQVGVIAQFLPEQMSDEAVKNIVAKIIEKVGATSMKDMGTVMGMASKELAGKADGKAISMAVKQLLA